jgi:hypothetical protein
MQINNANFAQTYQSINQSQPTSNKIEPTINKIETTTPEQRNNVVDAALDKRNELQQTQEQSQQQKRSAATGIIDHNQTQDNIETYTNAYQNATGNDSSSSSSNSLSYRDLQEMNQTIQRHQIANSDVLGNIVDRREEEVITIYSPVGIQKQSQAGSVISAYA